MKQIYLFPLILLFLVNIVLAVGPPSFPYQVHITATYDGRPLVEQEITVKHIYSGRTITIVTNDDGEALFDAQESYPRFLAGDELIIKICERDVSPRCEQTVFTSTGAGSRFSIEAKEIISRPAGCLYDNPRCSEGFYCKSNKCLEFVTCWDGSKVTSASLCPPRVEPVTYVCEDGTIVTNLNECLETETQIKGYIIGGGVILGGLGIVYLIRYYTKKKQRTRAKK